MYSTSFITKKGPLGTKNVRFRAAGRQGSGQFFSLKLLRHHQVSELRWIMHYFWVRGAFEIWASFVMDPLLTQYLGRLIINTYSAKSWAVSWGFALLFLCIDFIQIRVDILESWGNSFPEKTWHEGVSWLCYPQIPQTPLLVLTTVKIKCWKLDTCKT